MEMDSANNALMFVLVLLPAALVILAILSGYCIYAYTKKKDWLGQMLKVTALFCLAVIALGFLMFM